MWRDVFLLGARSVQGPYVMGHGAQKLFGSFGGPGPERAGRHFAKIGLEPGEPLARIAAAAELGGGALTAAGLVSPLGPVAIGSTMLVAAGTAHRGHGYFSATGGPELALTNLAVAAALGACGPGRLSLDALLGTGAPRWSVRIAVGAAVVTGVALVARSVAAERRATSQPAPAPTPDVDDGLDEVGRESFPASDPPASNFGRAS